mmetsp:Transcript_32025/g.80348  ORF Transcript_32025/g.80348 Transcript_32025/m.80348 type:complete len:262 (-) Transcript_32025:1594-2379(-)
MELLCCDIEVGGNLGIACARAVVLRYPHLPFPRQKVQDVDGHGPIAGDGALGNFALRDDFLDIQRELLDGTTRVQRLGCWKIAWRSRQGRHRLTLYNPPRGRIWRGWRKGQWLCGSFRHRLHHAWGLLQRDGGGALALRIRNQQAEARARHQVDRLFPLGVFEVHVGTRLHKHAAAAFAAGEAGGMEGRVPVPVTDVNVDAVLQEGSQHGLCPALRCNVNVRIPKRVRFVGAQAMVQQFLCDVRKHFGARILHGACDAAGE